MKRLIIALTLTIVTFGLSATDLNAAGGPWKKWRAYGRPAVKAPANTPRMFQHYSPYHSVEDAYPRYIGAFHSRYFNDLGVPSGDVGARANTLYMLPW